MKPYAVTRRQTLTGALAAAALPAAVLPAAALPAAALPAGNPDWIGTLAARTAALKGPGLLRSYDVEGQAPFDRVNAQTAYVYDNAAAGLALLAAGHIDLARRIGDGLRQAQANDRYWRDGRLRNAYRAGPAPAAGSYPMPGWWDEAANKWVEDAYQAGTATGVVAWAMLLFLGLGRACGDAGYTQAAARAGDWVARTTQVPRGFSGGFLGFEPGPQRLGWVSTEHNIDLANAFAQLGRPQDALHARAFVGEMWNTSQGRFDTGLRPDGTVNDLAAVDANIWPLLLPLPLPEWARSLDWVMANQGVPTQTPEGVSFSTARDGIWLEGTAYVALAARRARRPALAASMLATLRAQTSPGGLVWASSIPRLETGLSTGLLTGSTVGESDSADFFYYRRPHIGATAWAALAAAGANPFAA